SEEHTSELQSLTNLVCRLLLEKKTPWSSIKGKRRKKVVPFPRLLSTLIVPPWARMIQSHTESASPHPCFLLLVNNGRNTCGLVSGSIHVPVSDMEITIWPATRLVPASTESFPPAGIASTALKKRLFFLSFKCPPSPFIFPLPGAFRT